MSRTDSKPNRYPEKKRGKRARRYRGGRIKLYVRNDREEFDDGLHSTLVSREAQGGTERELTRKRLAVREWTGEEESE
jgi:hypothetical protein